MEQTIYIHYISKFILLGSKYLGQNIQNHICIVLANREQDMSSLGFRQCLKVGVLSFKSI